MEYKTHKALDGELIDQITDTGSLRGDLLRLLTLYQSVYIEVGPEIMNAVLFEMSQQGEEIQNHRKYALEKNALTMRKIIAFAQARGEKIRKISPLTLTLPFDLIRIENILHQTTMDARHLEHLVDEILLPVYQAIS
ncbi:TetR-like C-terminal domain-containing protein [Ktedonospora formicarum]|uniref:Tetracyclin repressor-like C-terminal domain-containing protein n=1 Tax=Ktedonospora formicarum TaxID=2778364 RepID=A0A8J3MV29_9CHLR|nr:TetR-like C-terminal domain-containing protein [Ktedonospora formicarum]GHO46055.1 hypothetical protein KSX_42180 [Ktedonospora formicarum]